MTIEEVTQYANDNELDLTVFAEPSYEGAIIGISSDDRVIYDYNLMITDLMQKEEMSEVDAIEFIEYNTLRSLARYTDAPVILRYTNYGV